MSEVIKLHQDEGVINLLHALPASRRRPSSTYPANSQSPNVASQQVMLNFCQFDFHFIR